MMFAFLTAGPGYSATDVYRNDYIARLNRDFTRTRVMWSRETVRRV